MRIVQGEIILSNRRSFDIGKDRLLLNYDVTHNNNDSNTLGSGPGFSTNDASQSTACAKMLVTYIRKNLKKLLKVGI
jgi:hypothetical protein